MIDRSGFLRPLLALGSASLFAFFAACGGKIDGGAPTHSSGDGGQGGDSSACTGTFECPVCEGDPTSGEPTCIDGEWECPATKCVPPPPNGCQNTVADCKCGTASCVNDAWVCPADCSDTCPVDISGLAGTACSVEGLICGGEDCTNPCDFCNFVGCQGGIWTNEESPPEPCAFDAGSPGGG